MKKGLLVFLFLNLTVSAAYLQAQSISCQKLFEIVTSDYEQRDQVTCFNSSMLTKAIYYRWEGMGFVVGYIKSNDYDFSGKPYIFCGISESRWRSFKSGGMYVP